MNTHNDRDSCHITAGNDQFDNDYPNHPVADDEVNEAHCVREIAYALIDGDTYDYGRYSYSFSNVIEDGLYCDAKFANVLRKLMIGKADDAEVVKELRDMIYSETLEMAQNIHDEETS